MLVWVTQPTAYRMPPALKSLVGAILATGIYAQGPGNGLSKTTYSANNALTGLDFNLK